LKISIVEIVFGGVMAKNEEWQKTKKLGYKNVYILEILQQYDGKYVF